MFSSRCGMWEDRIGSGRCGKLVCAMFRAALRLYGRLHAGQQIADLITRVRRCLASFRRHYFLNTQGVIFVVDSNDRARFPEAREELSKMVAEEELRNAVVLVFANKQDLPNAASSAEIVNALGLPDMRNRPWFIMSCCATNGDGLFEGLDWLADKLKKT